MTDKATYTKTYLQGKEEGYSKGAEDVMARVNEFLANECKIEHPRGMHGLRNLLQQREGHRQAYEEQLAGTRQVDDLRMREIGELKQELKDYKELMAERIHDEFEHLKEWMQQHQGAGPYVVSLKLKEIEHHLKEGR